MFLEILFPGSVLSGTIVLVFWQLQPGVLASAEKGSGLLAAAIFTVVSYLLGLTTREYPIATKSTAYHFNHHLKAKWHSETLPLAKRLRASSVGISLDLPRSTSAIDEAWTHEFVSLLRDRLLSECETSWSDYLIYQWNIARLARNTVIPLYISAGVGIILGIWQISRSAIELGIGEIISSIVLVGLAQVLRRVYRQRLCWHLDILMRTGVSRIK